MCSRLWGIYKASLGQRWPEHLPTVPTTLVLDLNSNSKCAKMPRGWRANDGWRLNENWDPSTSKDPSSPLKPDYSYLFPRPTLRKLDWSQWNCERQQVEESDWHRSVAYIPVDKFLDAFLPVSPISTTHLRRLQASNHLSGLGEENRHANYVCCVPS